MHKGYGWTNHEILFLCRLEVSKEDRKTKKTYKFRNYSQVVLCEDERTWQAITIFSPSRMSKGK